MDALKKLNLTGLQLLKYLGLIGLGLLVLLTLNSSFNNLRSKSVSLSMDSYAVPNGLPSPSLSARNVGESSQSYEGGYTAGTDNEAFEVKHYSASIETRNLDRDCAVVSGLKSRPEVIFESSNLADKNCSYTFKVKKDSVQSILAILNDLDPKELSETSYTIKREVNDYTSEIQILENKLASLDKTLADAIASYESIGGLATEAGNVDTLARIIESKLTMIERLNNARIEAVNQLERINLSKSEALDKLEYTYFYVNLYESKFVDGEAIKASWKQAVQQFLRDINILLQDISIGFIGFLLMLIKFALYFVVIVMLARLGWGYARKVWQIENKS